MSPESVAKDETPVETEDTKPFWASKSFWGAILCVASFFFRDADILAPEAQGALAGALAVIGGALGVWGRWGATKGLRARK